MKVSVIGGGHIGTTLACYIKHYDPSVRVFLYTKRPERFAEQLFADQVDDFILLFPEFARHFRGTGILY